MSDTFQPVDLWVLPTPSYSRWFTRLDWYLNWQMCKGLAYGGLHLPSETHRIADEFGVPVLPPHSETEAQAPLLIAPVGKVPARRCLVLDGAGSEKAWIAEIAKLAGSLQAREIRVFLPTGFSVAQAEKIWKDTDCVAHFTADLERT